MYRLIFISRREYRLLNLLEFNSARKRMSVIVSVEGEIFLLCKGADEYGYFCFTRIENLVSILCL